MVRAKGKAIGCPKLDEPSAYINKLAPRYWAAQISKSVKVRHMRVPCRYGVVHIAEEPLPKGWNHIFFQTVMIGVRSKVIGRNV